MARLFVPAGFDAASISPDLYLFLQKEPDDLLVLLEFHSPGRDRRQIDVAVLGPYGVDVVEVKAKVGGAVIASDNGPWHVRRDDGRTEAIPLNGAAGENPYDQADRTAKDFGRWLEKGLGVCTGVFPLVLVPRYRRDANLRNRGFVWATNGLQGFKRSLRSLRPYKGVPESLAPDDHRRIIDALELTQLGVGGQDSARRAVAGVSPKEPPAVPRHASWSATPIDVPERPRVQPGPDDVPPPSAAAPERAMWPFALAGFVAVVSLLGVRQAVLAPRAAGPAPTTLAASTEASPPAVAAEAPASVRPVGSSCPGSHPVKGNVNGEGERIFHVEGQRYYETTHPQACFADADAAVAGGFRASLR